MNDNELAKELAALYAAVKSLAALAVRQQASIAALRLKLAEFMVERHGGDLNAQITALMASEENLHEIALIGIEDVDPRIAAILDKRKNSSSSNQKPS